MAEKIRLFTELQARYRSVRYPDPKVGQWGPLGFVPNMDRDARRTDVKPEVRRAASK